MRFWSEVRSEEEIQGRMGHRVAPDAQNLIAYYRLDEPAGDTVRDASTNEYHGTLGPADIGLAAPERIQAFLPPPSVAGVGDAGIRQ